MVIALSLSPPFRSPVHLAFSRSTGFYQVLCVRGIGNSLGTRFPHWDTQLETVAPSLRVCQSSWKKIFLVLNYTLKQDVLQKHLALATIPMAVVNILMTNSNWTWWRTYLLECSICSLKYLPFTFSIDAWKHMWLLFLIDYGSFSPACYQESSPLFLLDSGKFFHANSHLFSKNKWVVFYLFNFYINSNLIRLLLTIGGMAKWVGFLFM